MRTLCPCGAACSIFAIGMNGCTSPREPHMCIAMFNRGLAEVPFSLINSSTSTVLPLRGLARCAEQFTAASFWTLSNQYFRCAVFRWKFIATWPNVLTRPVLCAFSSWYWPCRCLLLKLRGIAQQTTMAVLSIQNETMCYNYNKTGTKKVWLDAVCLGLFGPLIITSHQSGAPQVVPRCAAISLGSFRLSLSAKKPMRAPIQN